MKRTIGSIAQLLIIGMMLGIVAGCAGTTPTATTTGTTTGAPAVATPAATTKAGASNLNPPGQLPVCKDPETLRIVNTQSPHVMPYTYDVNKLTKFLQDRTNVTIEHILYPEDDATTKLKIELSTKGDLGYLIKELMKTDPSSYTKITAPDGHIYALPRGGLTGITPNAYAMRQWVHTGFLEKYRAVTGKGTPVTTDEFEGFLAWCVASDPNGNGKADEVGWTGAEKASVWYARPTGFLMNAFTLQNQDGYHQKNDVIHCALVEAGYRRGLQYLARLMEAGLMDPAYPDNDENAIKTLVALECDNNVAGGNTVATISCGGMHNAATDHKIRNAYQIMAPLRGPDGLANAFYDHYITGATLGKASVPASGSKPDLAIAWMDTMYDQEVYYRSQYGEPGVGWETPAASTRAAAGGPGRYRSNTKQFSVPTSSNWFNSGPAMWNRNGSYTQPKVPKTFADGNSIHDLEGSLYNASRLYEDFVIPCSVPPFFFDMTIAAKTGEWKTAIDTYCRTAITDYIFGRRNINDDKDWAAYVAGAKALGLDDYLQTMQENYDANWKGTLPEVYEKKPLRTA